MQYIIQILTILLTLSLSFNVVAKSKGLDAKIESKISHNDNIFGTTDELSDAILTISPLIKYSGVYGKHDFSAEYKGNYARFNEYSDANYSEHEASAELNLSLTNRWSSKFGSKFDRYIERPGSINQALIAINEYNEVDAVEYNVETSYGNAASVGQILLRYYIRDVSFKNNMQYYRDRNEQGIRGSFYWRLAPKSRALFEVRQTNLDSESLSGFDQSLDQHIYLTGVDWATTSKVSGKVLVGYQDTKFDNPLIEGINGLSYFIDIDYKVKDGNNTSIAMTRTTRDNAGNFVGGLESEDYSFRWDSLFKYGLNLEVVFEYRRDSFTGVSRSRKDENIKLKSELGYRVSSWLKIFLLAEHLKRNSDDDIYNFKNNQVTIGLSMDYH